MDIYSTMDGALARFLAGQTPVAEESAVWQWQDHPIHLHITAYLGQELPPLAYVTSVRTLLFRDDSIMVLRNADNTWHVVPGGRREAGETAEATLRREVLEETGWTLTTLSLLGFFHFHHQSPKPPGFPHHYPDFIQIVYVAQAGEYRPDAQLPSEYEVEASFRPLSDLHSLGFGPGQHHFLAAALAQHGANR